MTSSCWHQSVLGGRADSNRHRQLLDVYPYKLRLDTDWVVEVLVVQLSFDQYRRHSVNKYPLRFHCSLVCELLLPILVLVSWQRRLRFWPTIA